MDLNKMRNDIRENPQEKTSPFEMRVPNKLTAETLSKSERGEVCITPRTLMRCSPNSAS